jgi:hypothetical protein
VSALAKPSLSPSAQPLRRWEPILRARLWQLDLASLFAVLRHLGLGWDELRFSSHATIESPTRLIHDLELDDDPRQARITLNMGLLGPQSPLPGYFFKELDGGTLDATTFGKFIRFFDHVALARLMLALHPELDDKLDGDRERTRREELQLMNLRSSSTLHWLFAQTFPELDVRVEGLAKWRQLRTGALRLGSAVLGGEGTFGSRAIAVAPGRRVTLFCDDERTGSGRPWPLEARARIDEIIVPLLKPFAVALETFLVLREQRSFARLSDTSHLGYDPLRGAQARRRIKVYDTSEEDKP